MVINDDHISGVNPLECSLALLLALCTLFSSLLDLSGCSSPAQNRWQKAAVVSQEKES